jgi:flagellar hook protein FlgE
MAFQTGLSGLDAASRSLDVIGNNIANANTTGMKSSRAEFADVVASSIGVGGGDNAGLGVGVDTVSQQFSQGNLSVTGNGLDVAINGAGFFQLQMADGTTAYTRSGNFKMDNLGNIVTNANAKVMGFPTTVAGVATSTTPVPLTLPTGAPIAAKATAGITAEFNLDATAPIAASVVPPTPRSTYGTALTAYDSQGVALPVSLYFTKVAQAVPTVPPQDQWDVYDSLAPAATPVGSLLFDATGQLTSGSPVSLTLTPVAPSIVPPFTVSADMSKATQYGAAFGVTNLTQDGYASGSFTGMKISTGGVITATYSNGQTQAAGMLALANFRNVQGLAPVGGNNWVETYTSGQPLLGQPGQGNFGNTQAGSLEDSNVDLTAELVNMMTAQRAYQANAQTIKTQDQVMQTLVNLR